MCSKASPFVQQMFIKKILRIHISTTAVIWNLPVVSQGGGEWSEIVSSECQIGKFRRESAAEG